MGQAWFGTWRTAQKTHLLFLKRITALISLPTTRKLQIQCFRFIIGVRVGQVWSYLVVASEISAVILFKNNKCVFCAVRHVPIHAWPIGVALQTLDSFYRVHAEEPHSREQR